jgi:hypothetical protein
MRISVEDCIGMCGLNAAEVERPGSGYRWIRAMAAFDEGIALD